jgi:hypothetical protein
MGSTGAYTRVVSSLTSPTADVRPFHGGGAAALLAGLAVVLAALPAGAAEPPRDLDPIPPAIVFVPDPDGPKPGPGSTQAIAQREIGRGFASLGDVRATRHLLVRRIGLVSVPALAEVLNEKRGAYVWNAALTIAALRDTHGAAPELYPTLRSLFRQLSASGEDFHTAGFCALALGCFHWAEARLPERYRTWSGYAAVPGPMRVREKAVRTLEEARAVILRLSEDPQAFRRVSALLSLAKFGGPKARAGLLTRKERDDAHIGEQQARLIAHALVRDQEVKTFTKALRHKDKKVRAAAALAIGVSLLVEQPVAWTKDHEPLLEAMGYHEINVKEDAAEVTFTRGLLALQREEAGKDFEALWGLAKTASTEIPIAEAAAQALLFADPTWFDEIAVEWAGNARSILKHPVLALVLLRAGMVGTDRGVDACEKWLRNRAQRPDPDDVWDPRWYAAVGLMRALNAGRVKRADRRARIVDTLHRAVGHVLDRRSAFRAALAEILERHGRKITSAPETRIYRLPTEELQALEASFDCPHALLSREPIDVCVHRVNNMVGIMFGLDGIRESKQDKPSTDKQPEKYLKRYLEDHPYFSRLDFRLERGVRPQQHVDPSDPLVFDR